MKVNTPALDGSDVLLKTLLSMCEFGVFVSVNEHRNCYESVDSYLDHNQGQVPDEVLSVMRDTDTVVHVQMFKHSAGSSISIYHYDLNSALIRAVAVCEGWD